MTQKQDPDYKDPILTPGNLRKIVNSLPGKAKVCFSKEVLCK